VIDENSSRACSDFCGRVKKGCGTPDIFVPTGCTSTQPDEADDEDDSIQAKPSENDDDDDTTRDAPTGSSEGSCWSATLEKQMPANACVQSESTSLWYQCNDGKWYRGVEGGRGRFGQCTSRTGL
jgi:hypothetical protein